MKKWNQPKVTKLDVVSTQVPRNPNGKHNGVPDNPGKHYGWEKSSVVS